MSIDESEVANALSMMREGHRLPTQAATPVRADPPDYSNVELRDGTSLDLNKFVDARIQSLLAQYQAKEQQKRSEAESGPSGWKRPLETTASTHRVDSSKRLRPSMASTVEDHRQGYSQDEYDSDESSYSDEDDEDQFRMSSVFGVGVNSDPTPTTVEARKDVARSEVFQPSPARPLLHDGAGTPSVRPVSEFASHAPIHNLGNTGEVELDIDKDLYVPRKNTPNWSPAPGTINFAVQYFDQEWTAEQVKEYEQAYVPPPEYKHIFTPIPITKAMDQALSSQYTKDTDKFFNRRETERMLFRAAKDICAAYGPIFHGLCLLGQKGGCEPERKLLTEGILGVSSAMLKITRARRELIRRYFDFGVARELYEFSPSHTQFFGGSSFEERVKEAKALSDSRNNLFFRPKPKTFKSAKSKAYNKAAGFQDQSQQQNNQYRRRQGRGRGRRYNKKTKGQPAAAKTSESK